MLLCADNLRGVEGQSSAFVTLFSKIIRFMRFTFIMSHPKRINFFCYGGLRSYFTLSIINLFCFLIYCYKTLSSFPRTFSSDLLSSTQAPGRNIVQNLHAIPFCIIPPVFFEVEGQSVVYMILFLLLIKTFLFSIMV